ncbi:MAG: ribonuclease HIII [Ignavibacteriaceae bacterium]
MNAIEQSALRQIEEHKNKLIKQLINVSEVKKKKFNYEADVYKGKDKLKLLVYFGKNGIKSVLQGNKETKLYSEVNNLIFKENLSCLPARQVESIKEDFTEPKSYIGTDESGKGDYFGPLVIAGVFADEKNIKLLKAIGVKDSKELSGKSIKLIANEIKKTVQDNFEIILITPKKYNELYSKIKNVNKILGWGHAKVLENLLLRCEAKEAISDKFGDESLIRNSLQEKGKNILLHQFTKAEKYTAVAAASILAREKLVEWFDAQNKVLKIALPKGASNAVNEAAIQIRKLYGAEKLNELVKLHFKTTAKVFSN